MNRPKVTRFSGHCVRCPTCSHVSKAATLLVAQQKDPDTGFDLSVIRSFDGVSRKEINRVDALWGLGWLYRELACVVIGS